MNPERTKLVALFAVVVLAAGAAVFFLTSDHDDGQHASHEEQLYTCGMHPQVIQDHLELKRRNAAIEHEMPLERYLTDDPCENHPLFKTEEQARVEETMDGVQSIVDEPTSLDWPTVEDTFVNAPAFTCNTRLARARMK